MAACARLRHRPPRRGAGAGFRMGGAGPPWPRLSASRRGRGIACPDCLGPGRKGRTARGPDRAFAGRARRLAGAASRRSRQHRAHDPADRGRIPRRGCRGDRQPGRTTGRSAEHHLARERPVRLRHRDVAGQGPQAGTRLRAGRAPAQLVRHADRPSRHAGRPLEPRLPGGPHAAAPVALDALSAAGIVRFLPHRACPALGAAHADAARPPSRPDRAALVAPAGAPCPLGGLGA